MFKSVKSLVTPLASAAKQVTTKGHLSAAAQPKPNQNPEIQFTGVNINEYIFGDYVYKLSFYLYVDLREQ